MTTQPTNPPLGPEVWEQSELLRGRAIQNELAQSDYQGYVETDKLPGYEKAKNFPLIDFVSQDHTHSVSAKTYNPYSKAFGDLTTHEDLVEHANELVLGAPGDRVTLDVRVPPGTPPGVMNDLKETVDISVDDPRLETVVQTWPPSAPQTDDGVVWDPNDPSSPGYVWDPNDPNSPGYVWDPNDPSSPGWTPPND
jgi:hypothetical protein